MKKIIILIISIYACEINSQCVGDNSTDPCCNQIICTDPKNNYASSNDRPFPMNGSTGYVKNSFDWLTRTFDFKNVALPYNNPMAQPTTLDYRGVINLRDLMAGESIPDYLSNHNLHPKNGWELLHANFNHDWFPDNDAEAMKTVAGPTIVLYNKYTGLIRYLVSPGIGGDDYDKIIFELSQIYLGSNQNKLLNNYSSAILSPANQMRALDQKAEVTLVQSSGPVAAQYDWTYGDFQTEYDPCVCQYPGRLKIKTYGYKTADVKLEGRGIGINYPLDNSGSNPIAEGEKWLASVWSESASPSQGKTDWVVKNGIQTVKDAKTLVDIYKSDPVFNGLIKILNMGVSAASGGKGFLGSSVFDFINGSGSSHPLIASLADSLTKSKYIKGFSKVGDILSGGASFLSTLDKLSGNVADAPPNISFSRFELQMGGIIEDYNQMTNVPVLELANPGSLLSNESNRPWTYYPMYNEAFGSFALLKTPKVLHQYAMSNQEYEDPSCSYKVRSCGSMIFLTKVNTKTLDHIFMKLAEPLEYTINPAAQVNLQKSEIMGNMEFTIYLTRQIKDMPCNLRSTADFNNHLADVLMVLRSNSNALNVLSVESSKHTDTFAIRLSTIGVPIDNFHKVYIDEYLSAILSVKGLDNANQHQQIWDYYFEPPMVKVTCNFTHLPNKYGIEHKSKHVYSYKTNTEVWSYYQAVASNYIDDCANNGNQSFDGKRYDVLGRTIHYTAHTNGLLNLKDAVIPKNLNLTNQTHILYGDIVVKDLNLVNSVLRGSDPNKTYTIYVTGSYTNSSNASSQGVVEPNIIIVPGNIFSTENLNPKSQDFVKGFCKDQNQYKANEPVNKLASATPSKSKSDFFTTLSLHPNPSTSLTTLTIENPSAEKARVMVYDLVGREVYSQDMKDVSASNNKLEISTDGWNTGIYIVKVIHGEVEKSIKLEVRY